MYECLRLRACVKGEGGGQIWGLVFQVSSKTSSSFCPVPSASPGRRLLCAAVGGVEWGGGGTMEKKEEDGEEVLKEEHVINDFFFFFFAFLYNFRIFLAPLSPLPCPRNNGCEPLFSFTASVCGVSPSLPPSAPPLHK